MEGNLSFYQTSAASCMATCGAEVITLPFDTLKVRLQIGQTRHSAGVFNTAWNLIKNEGVTSPWKGLSAGLQRQVVYGTLRFSIYTPIRDFYASSLKYDSNASSLYLKIFAGVTAGGIAMTIASPTDMVKVRLQADGARAAGTPRRYSGSLNAYSQILKTEGVRGLWVGATPNIVRNCILNATELACYDQVKQNLLETGYMNDGLALHFVGGATAGLAAAIVGNPVDLIKTRLMNAPPGEYKGVTDAIFKTVSSLGLKGLYKGFGPNCLRIGIFNICCFILLEKANHFVSKW